MKACKLRVKSENVHCYVKDTWQTKAHGSLADRYAIYIACADNGKGGDITRNGAPLLTFDEWIAR